MKVYLEIMSDNRRMLWKHKHIPNVGDGIDTNLLKGYVEYDDIKFMSFDVGYRVFVHNPDIDKDPCLVIGLTEVI